MTPQEFLDRYNSDPSGYQKSLNDWLAKQGLRYDNSSSLQDSEGATTPYYYNGTPVQGNVGLDEGRYMSRWQEGDDTRMQDYGDSASSLYDTSVGNRSYISDPYSLLNTGAGYSSVGITPNDLQIDENGRAYLNSDDPRLAKLRGSYNGMMSGGTLEKIGTMLPMIFIAIFTAGAASGALGAATAAESGLAAAGVDAAAAGQMATSSLLSTELRTALQIGSMLSDNKELKALSGGLGLLSGVSGLVGGLSDLGSFGDLGSMGGYGNFDIQDFSKITDSIDMTANMITDTLASTAADAASSVAQATTMPYATQPTELPSPNQADFSGVQSSPGGTAPTGSEFVDVTGNAGIQAPPPLETPSVGVNAPNVDVQQTAPQATVKDPSGFNTSGVDNPPFSADTSSWSFNPDAAQQSLSGNATPNVPSNYLTPSGVPDYLPGFNSQLPNVSTFTGDLSQIPLGPESNFNLPSTQTPSMNFEKSGNDAQDLQKATTTGKGILGDVLDFAKENPVVTSILGRGLLGGIANLSQPSIDKAKAEAQAQAQSQAAMQRAAAQRAATSYGGVRFGVTPTGVMLRTPGTIPNVTGLLARR